MTGSITIDGTGNPILYVVHGASTAAVTDVRIGQSHAGSLNVSQSVSFYSNSAYLGLEAASSGTLSVHGGDARYETILDVSVGVSGTGRVEVSDSAILMSRQSFFGFGDNSMGTAILEGVGTQWLQSQGANIATGLNSVGTVTVTDHALFKPASLAIGWLGQGTLNVGGGAQVIVDNSVDVASLSAATGTANVTGTGTSFTIANVFNIGRAGSGTVIVDDGALVTASTIHVAALVGSTGSLVISGNGTRVEVQTDTIVGTGAYPGVGVVGSLLITDGAALQAKALNITYGGHLTLDTGGQINVQSYNRVGGDIDFKGGTLTINGGPYFHHGAFGSPVNSSPENLLAVNGLNNPRLVLNGIPNGQIAGVEGLAVGTTQSGQLIFSGGTYLEMVENQVLMTTISNTPIYRDNVYLGVAPGSNGALTVTGSNTHLNYSGATLYVGYGGTGSLNIGSGGKITGVLAQVGFENGSLGTAVISGPSALWSVTSLLEVGVSHGAVSGNGSLVVADGGTVEVKFGMLRIGEHGSLTISSGGNVLASNLELLAGGEVQLATGATLTTPQYLHFAGDLILNGRIQGSPVIDEGGTIGGSGVIVGKLSGAGLVAPGNSPGVLDVQQLDASSGLDFLFQFTAANTAPNYLNRTDSLNDVLHLTHGTSPFFTALSAANKITIDFQVGALHDGDFFLGGFFTNLLNNDFTGMISNADFEFLVNGSPLDTGVWQIGIDTIQQPGVDFGNDYGGEVDGRVMRATVSQVQAVPEPSSMILCALGAGGYYWRRRKQKLASPGVADSQPPTA